ncbi:AAA family ATPase [Kiloniella sp.]|uniref:AAA family ATPase n=1 Tax=Kiloniella sp. TaxID=1938587 RepID=UPI003A940293
MENNFYQNIQKLGTLTSLYVDNQQTLFAKEDLKAFLISEKASETSSYYTLLGEAGAGKTMFVKQFCKANSRINSLYVKLPSACTRKAVAQSILFELEDPNYLRTGATSHNMMARTKHWLQKKNIGLIFLDEAQQLIESKNEKVIYDTSEWLKDAVSDWGIPVVFVGLPKFIDVITSNDQFSRRRWGHTEFPEAIWENMTDRKEWCSFLHEVEGGLPFPTESNLSSPAIAHAILQATGGMRGIAIQLIIRAAKFSLSDGEFSLSVRKFSRAYQDLSLGVQNPFSGLREKAVA